MGADANCVFDLENASSHSCDQGKHVLKLLIGIEDRQIVRSFTNLR